MRFANREEAGRLLAQELANYKDRHNVVVLGLARGGLPVALEVAKALHVPLDVMILRKLGVPGHEELAFGAIASGGIHIIDQEVVDAVGLSPVEMHQALTHARQELDRRERLYRADRPPLKLKGKTVILVDDGIATGSSMRAAIAALRKADAARIVVAVPVAPENTCHRLRREADEVICTYTPENFFAVGAFYNDFSQVTDDEVAEILRQSSLGPDGKVA